MAANDRITAEFRAAFTYRDVKVELGAEPSVFVASSLLGPVTATVSAGEPADGDPRGADLILTVLTWREVTGKPAEALRAQWARSIPPTKQQAREAVLDGSATLPQYLEELFDDVGPWAADMRNRVMGLYQWRWGLPIRTRPRFRRVAYEYSIVAGEWRPIPRTGSLVITAGRPHLARLGPRHGSGVDELLQADLGMPLGHELLAEAQELASTAARSSLMLSISALEVGFKGMVTILVPDAEWLVSELPSPPLVRLLQDYLPKLPRRGRASDREPETVSPHVLDQVKKAVHIRNRLAHQGKSSIDTVWLAQWLSLCVDLLYLFDFYGGQPWALERIGPEDLDKIIQ